MHVSACSGPALSRAGGSAVLACPEPRLGGAAPATGRSPEGGEMDVPVFPLTVGVTDGAGATRHGQATARPVLTTRKPVGGGRDSPALLAYNFPTGTRALRRPGLQGPSAACPHQLCDLQVRGRGPLCVRREQRPNLPGTARPLRSHMRQVPDKRPEPRRGSCASCPAPRWPTPRSDQRSDPRPAWRPGTLTLTTGGVGGTTGMMGVAGGGGAAAGGAGTGVTFAVMVGTGVAAMTGV